MNAALITTVAALVYQAYGFFFGAKPSMLLGVMSIILVVLATYVAIEVVPRGIPRRQEAEAPVAPE